MSRIALITIFIAAAAPLHAMSFTWDLPRLEFPEPVMAPPVKIEPTPVQPQ